MRVLVACEFSGRVTEAFKTRGHDAWSVDTQPTIGDPRTHIRADIREVLALGPVLAEPWDLMIAFPPCTALTAAGQSRYGGTTARAEALGLVRELLEAPIPRIALENPRGAISTSLRRPDQIIQPYYFGHPYTKMTCLWLKALPHLTPTNKVQPLGSWHDAGPKTGHRRGLTFRGIADAMADQWGKE
jgi:site-specific DNA-cytosine methylase